MQNNLANLFPDRDPAPVFFNTTTQTLLKKLTGQDMKKIFYSRHFERHSAPPKYVFLTRELTPQTEHIKLIPFFSVVFSLKLAPSD